MISAGAVSPAVVCVAAISSQTYGTDLADELSPRPLLLMHGTADRVLPDTVPETSTSGRQILKRYYSIRDAAMDWRSAVKM